MTSNIISSSDLTPKERNELALFCDGPITQTMVEDKIRARAFGPVRTAEVIQAEIEQEMANAAFWGASLDEFRAKGNEWMVHHSQRHVFECLNKVDALEREMDALTQPKLLAAE